MNKKDIILIVSVLLIVVIAFFVTNDNESSANIELPIALSGEDKGVVSIDYNGYAEKISNGDNFIVVIERTGCSYCEMYGPIVKEVAEEYSIPVYDLNIAEITEKEYELLNNSNSYLKRNKWGTPTTLLMSGENVAASLGGYVEKDEFISFIKTNVILSSNEESVVE